MVNLILVAIELIATLMAVWKVPKLHPRERDFMHLLHGGFNIYEYRKKERKNTVFKLHYPFTSNAGRGSLIGSVSAWHASGPEFDPHVRHILSWSWKNFYDCVYMYHRYSIIRALSSFMEIHNIIELSIHEMFAIFICMYLQ